jgi:hypothetical protein
MNCSGTINAVIYLNDEKMLDQAQHSGKSLVLSNFNYIECSADEHGFDNNHGHETNQNLFFLLSVSAPKPLFPVAGYPLIWHHIKALSKIPQVKNIFLIGKYKASKFQYFIETLYDEFPLSQVHYI